tara:strand:- start:901 stop:1284 length:384 start_codon:yes stop_codon:yes gene_type:complete
MSFSKAFRTARNSHGGKGGVFTWKGKKYNTNLREEVKKKKSSTSSVVAPKKTDNVLDKTIKKSKETTNKLLPNQGSGSRGKDGQVVSKTSPGEGWTKTTGTNIWSPPKKKKGGYKMGYRRRGGRKYA